VSQSARAAGDDGHTSREVEQLADGWHSWHWLILLARGAVN
jgi:hypothetical protein